MTEEHACLLQRSLENSLIASSLASAVDEIKSLLAEREEEYRYQVGVCGEGNTDVFLDEIEDARETLRKLEEQLAQVFPSFEPEDEDESP